MSAKRAAAPKSSGFGATKQQTNKPTHAPALAARSKPSGAKPATKAPPAKPTAKAPAKPVAKAPAVKPAPVKPVAKAPAVKPAPVKPAAKAPVKPAARVPSKPTAKPVARPAGKPAPRAPAKPAAKAPAKPATTAPLKPAAKAPLKSVAKAPLKPVAKAPLKPVAKAPAKPAAAKPPVAKAEGARKPLTAPSATKPSITPAAHASPSKPGAVSKPASASARLSKAPAAAKAPASTPLPALAAEPKSTARKVTQAVAEEAAGASPRQRTPKTRAPRARTVRADKAPAAAAVTTGKDKSMEDTAKPAARAVVRIARGLRTPKNAAPAPVKDDPTVLRREGPPPITRRSGAKIEINPRLERSKHLVTSTAPADGTAPKTMSVAAKHRAAAEAVFARLTVAETKPVEAEATAAAPLPFSARSADQGGGSFTMRVNEHDSAVTALRLASDRDETLAAARNLAERFKLPPDQSLLLRVVALGDASLTKLALEELLELEDRGRVRPSAELKTVLGGLVTQDPETREIKQLLLEKIGVTS